MNLLDGVDQNTDAARIELEAKWADKTKEEILKAKVESDLYIKTLEKRVDDIRPDYLKMQEELQARASLQTLIDQLNEKQKQPNETPPVKVESPFDPKQIESLLDNKFKAYEANKLEEQNYNTVKAKLIEKFGENYQTPLNQQINTLGLTPEDLNTLARTRPQMLIKALDLDTPVQRETFQSPPRSGQRNDHFAPKGGQVRDYNYYQELKKTNPKLYLDPKIAVQMHDDAVALGDKFGMPTN